MSIHPILQKIKAFVLRVESEAYLMILIIILVGLAAFGLGRLSTSGEGKAVIIQTGTTNNIEPNSSPLVQNEASAISALQVNKESIVASKNGTKYYLPDCNGVGRILEKNRVYFTSEKEAIDAGYTKASGC